MDTQNKLQLLSEASQYDLACACGTSNDDRRKRGNDGTWLYPVALPSGGTSVMLKTLQSNVCTNDCKYCPYRCNRDVRRCTLKPDEVAGIFMDYLRRKKVFGLFLSAGVMGDPDNTMAQLNATARLLRRRHQFRGYIHLKVIPGASDAAIEDAVSLASAVSLNIETPGQAHFEKLSEKKDYLKDIIHPIKKISDLTARGTRYARVKQTTQFIVGASDEVDTDIVKYAFGLYDRLHFQRIYFSAYQKGLGELDIPGEQRMVDPQSGDLFMREHRLYQVDFLIRRYGFREADILFDAAGNLDLKKDPKQVWADNHPGFFPVNAGTASRADLLRVPGLGPISVNRILKHRKSGRIRRPEDVRIKGKRSRTVSRYMIFE